MPLPALPFRKQAPAHTCLDVLPPTLVTLHGQHFTLRLPTHLPAHLALPCAPLPTCAVPPCSSLPHTLTYLAPAGFPCHAYQRFLRLCCRYHLLDIYLLSYPVPTHTYPTPLTILDCCYTCLFGFSVRLTLPWGGRFLVCTYLEWVLDISHCEHRCRFHDSVGTWSIPHRVGRTATQRVGLFMPSPGAGPYPAACFTFFRRDSFSKQFATSAPYRAPVCSTHQLPFYPTAFIVTTFISVLPTPGLHALHYRYASPRPLCGC